MAHTAPLTVYQPLHTQASVTLIVSHDLLTDPMHQPWRNQVVQNGGIIQGVPMQDMRRLGIATPVVLAGIIVHPQISANGCEPILVPHQQFCAVNTQQLQRLTNRLWVHMSAAAQAIMPRQFDPLLTGIPQSAISNAISDVPQIARLVPWLGTLPHWSPMQVTGGWYARWYENIASISLDAQAYQPGQQPLIALSYTVTAHPAAQPNHASAWSSLVAEEVYAITDVSGHGGMLGRQVNANDATPIRYAMRRLLDLLPSATTDDDLQKAVAIMLEALVMDLPASQLQIALDGMFIARNVCSVMPMTAAGSVLIPNFSNLLTEARRAMSTDDIPVPRGMSPGFSACAELVHIATMAEQHGAGITSSVIANIPQRKPPEQTIPSNLDPHIAWLQRVSRPFMVDARVYTVDATAGAEAPPAWVIPHGTMALIITVGIGAHGSLILRLPIPDRDPDQQDGAAIRQIISRAAVLGIALRGLPWWNTWISRMPSSGAIQKLMRLGEIVRASGHLRRSGITGDQIKGVIAASMGEVYFLKNRPTTMKDSAIADAWMVPQQVFSASHASPATRQAALGTKMAFLPSIFERLMEITHP